MRRALRISLLVAAFASRGVFVASYTDEPENGLPPLSGSDEVVLTPTP